MKKAPEIPPLACKDKRLGLGLSPLYYILRAVVYASSCPRLSSKTTDRFRPR